MSARPEPSPGNPPVVRWLDQEPPLVGTVPRASKPRRLSWLPGVALGVLVLGLVIERQGKPDVTGPVPDEFVGLWRSPEARYRDRGFTIAPDSLWLQLGPEVTIAYPLVGTRKRNVGAGVVYTIVYGDTPSLQEMELQLNPDSTVHLANTPSVRWRREQQ